MYNRRFGFITFACLFFLSFIVFSEASGAVSTLDDNDWLRFGSSPEAGFSEDRMAVALNYFESLRPNAAAFMVIYKGKALADWGDTTTLYLCHSVRKSFMSGLIGIYKAEGYIDLQKTIAELGIDDKDPLTDEEKKAKVIHLLKARSGIYHPAAFESQGMKDLRPERGSHPADTFWYYNNWDFNVLGVIFRQETGKDIFEEFKTRIADPIGMQDFRLDDFHYHYEYSLSIHPAYPFVMTARDRARYGQFFLQNGVWNGKRIIPEGWIKESTTSYSDASHGSSTFFGRGYGYMWWTMAPTTPILGEYEHLADIGSFYFAAGLGGHYIFVIPEEEMVFVINADTSQGLTLPLRDTFSLIDLVFDAKEFDIVDLMANAAVLKMKKEERGEKIRLSAQISNLSKAASNETTAGFYLSRDKELSSNDLLLGQFAVKPLAAQESRTLRLKTTIPENLKRGKWFVIFAIDREDVNADPYPENNLIICDRKIRIR